ncbi:MAG: hypothetical protein AAGD01_05980 [Acidobacteriota bacterium]
MRHPSQSLLLVLSLLCLLPAAANAATISADGVTCTLANAIVAANDDTPTGGCPAGDPGLDTIELDADVTLSAVDPASTLAFGSFSGLPDVTDDLILRAGSADLIQRDPTFTCEAATADPTFRFLYLADGSLTIEGIRFEKGCLVGSGNSAGGGILTASGTELNLTGVTARDQGYFGGNGGQGGFVGHRGDRLVISSSLFERITAEPGSSLQGGAIYISTVNGTTELNDVELREIDSSSPSSLQGGAIYSSSSDLSLTGILIEDVTVLANQSLQGGVIYVSGFGRTLTVDDLTLLQADIESETSTLQGGGIYASIVTQATNFSISQISATAGTDSLCEGGGFYVSQDPSRLTHFVIEDVECLGPSAARGGGLWIGFSFFDVYTVQDCAIRNARAVYGDNEAKGGGLFNFGTIESLERCAFLDNRAIPDFDAGNSDAYGGGLHIAGPATLRNITVAGNIAQGGTASGDGEDGGSAFGGGIAFELEVAESVDLGMVTLANNQAIAGEGAFGFAEGDARGGGLYLGSLGEVNLQASILSSNTLTPVSGDPIDEDCFGDGGTLLSGGYNVAVNPDASCDFSAFGDILALDPQLYPVDDYGCAMPLPDGSCVATAAIDQESWAVDWGSCATTMTFEDARSFLRRQDIIGVTNLEDSCDSGAFEARDSDGDGVTDVPDLCPMVADPSQDNADGDEFGDACDLCFGDNDTGDSDGDAVCDDSDLCAGDDASGDTDTDGVCNDSDLCAGDDASGDSDADGVCDDSDLCAGDDASGDSDTDGVCDDSDLCAGDDASGDSDVDGVCDNIDLCAGDDASGDSDTDGVCDDSDLCAGDDASGDSDADGVCDDLDLCAGDDASGDSDADGVCDDLDLCTGDDASGDSDGDGVCANLDCDDDDGMVSCTPIYDNGFETGDTSLWTLVVGGAP